ncbi:MAG: hypothetical protein ACQESP_12020 [Candidatus Muiribacteriota bacterium]
MKTYLTAIILGFIISDLFSRTGYFFAKKFNLLTYPDETTVFPKPVLNNYTYLITSTAVLIGFFSSIFFSPAFSQDFFNNTALIYSIFAVMIISTMLFIISEKRILLSIYLALFNTAMAYYNDILYAFGENIYINLFITFVWFMFFTIIFWTDDENINTNFLVYGIMSFTLFVISFYLGQRLSANIFLLTAISIFSIYRFSTYPPKILPDKLFTMWFSSFVAYMALVNNLKLTACAILLFFPLMNFIQNFHKQGTFNLKMLKNGIPEKKLNLYAVLIQLFAGLSAFIIIFIKNDIISFLMSVMFFISLYLVILKKTNKNDS